MSDLWRAGQDHVEFDRRADQVPEVRRELPGLAAGRKDARRGGGRRGGGRGGGDTGPSAAVEAQGIEVEGLDASSWALPTDTAAKVAAEDTTTALGVPFESSSSFAAVSAMPAAAREYKILSSRDKCFDGKFDLQRLEEALNQLARQGWVAKSMVVPHFKGYTGAMEEVITVLLERCHEAG